VNDVKCVARAQRSFECCAHVVRRGDDRDSRRSRCHDRSKSLCGALRERLLDERSQDGLVVARRRQEAGLAAGPGILAVQYPGACDGNCNLGGFGLEISPVVRYLFHTAAPYTLGAVLRAEIPLLAWSDSCFNTCNGRAVLVLGGIEAAFGWRSGR